MATPYDLILPAGKTCVLVDAGTVMLLKDAPADKPTRIFTAWASTIYDTNAARLKDIELKASAELVKDKAKARTILDALKGK